MYSTQTHTKLNKNLINLPLNRSSLFADFSQLRTINLFATISDLNLTKLQKDES